MSYRIEYQWVGLCITSDVAPGLGAPRLVIAIEGGDNNLTIVDHRGVERRQRSWDIGMIGTEVQVLRQATRFGSYCETGDIHPGGKRCTPEAYIRRIRRAMDHALDSQASLAYLGLGAELPVDHPVVTAPPLEGFTYYPNAYLGRHFVKFLPMGRERWAAYFDALDPYIDDLTLPPYRLGQIWGLPSS